MNFQSEMRLFFGSEEVFNCNNYFHLLHEFEQILEKSSQLLILYCSISILVKKKRERKLDSLENYFFQAKEKSPYKSSSSSFRDSVGQSLLLVGRMIEIF